MAKLFIEDSSLTAIGNAIRAKTGGTGALTVPDGMVNAINSIVAGGGSSGNNEQVKQLIERNIMSITNNDVTKIGGYAFHSCIGLTRAVFPNIIAIDSYAFQGCSSLSYVDIGNDGLYKGQTTIGTQAFRSCPDLKTLIIRDRQMASLLTSSVFSESAIATGTGYIYVRSDLVASYKTANYWNTYANQIRAIEDYPEITGG